MRGGYNSLLVDLIVNKFNRTKLRNGLYSVANFQVQTMTGCKLLKRLVPRAGVEPAPSYEERILSPLQSALPSLTKRYEPVFTGSFDVSRETQPSENSTSEWYSASRIKQ